MRSFRSFVRAPETPMYSRTARSTTVPVRARSNEPRGVWILKLVFPRSCKCVRQSSQEESRKGAHMEDCPAAAASSDKLDFETVHCAKVDFLPRILQA